MLVAINRDYGVFQLTSRQLERYNELTEQHKDKYVRDVSRFDETLIAAISTYPGGSVKIVEVPDNATDWTIIDYDGMEYVMCVLNGRLHEIF